MFYDGAKCKNGTGLVVLVSLEGDALRYAIQINFTNPTPTNNIVEYEGLLTSLRIAISLGIRRLLVKGDSEVVAQQTSKGYRGTNENMASYLQAYQRLESKFDGLEVQYIPRKYNTDADSLASQAASRQHLPGDVLVKVLEKPSIPISRSGPNPMLDQSSDEAILSEFLAKSMLGNLARASTLDGNEENWMDSIRAYLTNQDTLVDGADMEGTSHKAVLYTMVDGILYK
jgi:ribonuclease HI